ncbi:MAG: ribbon-helix-helix domain-containing protein [Candidatus Diapherotrites archaeon]|nr:ribbon-helix-helix domain-containing protein [Candidatus Diapherotrites archaeon]
MKTVTFKIPEDMARHLSKAIKKFHYGTQTEFIRSVIREKLLDLNLVEPTVQELSKSGLLQVKQSLKDLKAGRIRKVA